MRKTFSFQILCLVFATLCGETFSRGQALTGSSLNVSGSATIGSIFSGSASINQLASGLVSTNTLAVSGTVDILGNNLLFGTVSDTNAVINGHPGFKAFYTDGATSSFKLIATRPSHQWVWGRSTDISGTATIPMMVLDNALKIYDTNGSPAIVLDPNNPNGSNSVLTLQAADNRYVNRSALAVGAAPSIAFTGGSATGTYSFAGMNATASGFQSTAIGDKSVASGSFSVASGCSSTASGIYSTALGAYSIASGSFSMALGAYSAAYGDYAVTAGAYTTGSGYGQFVIGQYNVPQGDPKNWVLTDNLFVVGNGKQYWGDVWVDGYYYPFWADKYENGVYVGEELIYLWADGYYQNALITATSNAFVVKKNGDTTVYGKLTVSATNGSTLPNIAGATMAYTDGSSSQLKWTASGTANEWLWERTDASGSTTVPMMKLGADHALTIYNTSGSAAIILDPSTAGGQDAYLTQGMADGRYASSGAISLSSFWDYNDAVGTAVGLYGGQALGFCSFAGVYATATGRFATANAISATASGESSVASGNGANASGYSSVASGNGANAGGYSSVASGNGANASGDSSVASGNGANASGGDSIASGRSSNAVGYRSIASGNLSTANGDCSIASGNGATAGGWGAMSGGYMTVAQGCFQTTVGVCNIPQGNSGTWVPTDPLFIIGNGTFSTDPLSGNWLYGEDGNRLPDMRSNALVINKNGDTTVYGAFTVSGTNNNVNSITNGGLVVTGTAVPVVTSSGSGTKIISSGSNQLVLIPEQGDLSMGEFINGSKPNSYTQSDR